MAEKKCSAKCWHLDGVLQERNIFFKNVIVVMSITDIWPLEKSTLMADICLNSTLKTQEWGPKKLFNCCYCFLWTGIFPHICFCHWNFRLQQNMLNINNNIMDIILMCCAGCISNIVSLQAFNMLFLAEFHFTQQFIPYSFQTLLSLIF